MKLLSTTFCLLISIALFAQESKETQIAAAVQAAPESMREGAKVYGFVDGEFTVLQEGTNKTVCIADDPSRKGYSVSCYHSELDEFMARGRALKAEGKGFQEIFEIREEEVKSGKLKMPARATLHVLSGKEGFYNAETKTVDNATLRWVVYIPFSTSESTGLPTVQAYPGAPWIMDPGTHRAHIMIMPPAPAKN